MLLCGFLQRTHLSQLSVLKLKCWILQRSNGGSWRATQQKLRPISLNFTAAESEQLTLDTGLWLVQSDHMTWILASHWLRVQQLTLAREAALERALGALYSQNLWLGDFYCDGPVLFVVICHNLTFVWFSADLSARSLLCFSVDQCIIAPTLSSI